jgi:signal recognition particle subunit SRP68
MKAPNLVARCLAIGRSHAMARANVNTLALLNHGHEILQPAVPVLSNGPQPSPTASLDITVSGRAAQSLCAVLETQVTRYRALVHIDNLREANKDEHTNEVPLIDRLGEFPPGGVVDLDNIVEYPPKPTYVPLKPILLDLAWNYIDYNRPGEQAKPEATSEAKPQKKGWFGFGR